MGGSTPEEIAAQHAEAEQMVASGMECAPRQFLGPIPLEDKEQPTYLLFENNNRTEEEEEKKENQSGLKIPVCFTTRAFVDVSRLQDLVREGYHLTEELLSAPPSPKNYWDPRIAATQNVAITRPSHDAWGIQKIVLLFCDDFATRIYELPWYKHFEAELQHIFEVCLPPGASLIRLLFASLPPGVTIPSHHDTGEWVKHTHRVHVPILVPDPSRILFRCGPTPQSMARIDCEPGHVFEINNQAKHSVSNCSNDSRVHLILDYLETPGPERIVLSPGEELIQTRRSIDRANDMQERPAPSYIILGAQKAGTTSLYDYITQHPWVLPARRRETHCLDWRWKDCESADEELEHCQQFFFTELLRNRPSCLTGDSTPSYLLDSRRVIPRLKRVFPWNLKFFCILRDPVKRALSHYAMVTSTLGTPAQLKTRGSEWRQMSFRNVIQMELKTLKDCGLIPYFDVETGKVDHDRFETFFGSSEEDEAWDRYLANHVPLNTGSYGLLTRGMYALQLRPWFRAYSRDQFLVLRLESMHSKGVQAFMQPVWDHLDLPAHPVQDEEAKNTRGYQPMGQDVKEYLEAFFEPHSRKLVEVLTGDEWQNPWSVT